MRDIANNGNLSCVSIPISISMYIIRGVGNFARKIVTQQELGINPPNPDIKYFEFIQGYFHIFWIPFIGTNKGWYVRKKDDKLYHVSPQTEAELVRIAGNPKTSLWAYTGALILIAAMVVTLVALGVQSINESYERYLDNKHKEEARNQQWERIQHAALNDYCIFWWDSEWRAAKVIAVNEDSLQLSVMRKGAYEQPVVKKDSHGQLDTAGILTEFAEPGVEMDTLWYSKQKLKGMLQGEDGKWFQGIMTVTGGSLDHYLSVKSEGYGPGYLLYKLCTKNSVKVLEIKDSLNNVKFLQPFPIVLGRGGIALFRIRERANTNYKFDLLCEDIAGERFTCRLAN